MRRSTSTVAAGAALVCAAFVALSTSGGAAAYVRPGATTQVDVGPNGEQPWVPPTSAENGLESISISADGRFVAFDSYASNLVPGDTNGVGDVFVRDLARRITTRVSVRSDGGQAVGIDSPFLGGSIRPRISATGRFVVFESAALNLVSGDTNAATDVFLHDRRTGTTERVSIGPGGRQADGPSSEGSISDDGRSIAFASAAANLTNGDDNQAIDVFVRDRRERRTMLVSIEPQGRPFANMPDSNTPMISARGNHVVFTALKDGSRPEHTLVNPTEVFVRDLRTDTTEFASVSSDGAPDPGGVNHRNWADAISADGRYVVWTGINNAVPNQTNAAPDVFVHDRKTGRTERVSVGFDGAEAKPDGTLSRGAANGSITPNGRYVSFMSAASDLAPGYGNSTGTECSPIATPTGPSFGCRPYRIFVHDRRTGATEMVSRASDGRDPKPPFTRCGLVTTVQHYYKPDSYSYLSSISANGRYVAFGGCGLTSGEGRVDPPLGHDVDVTHLYVRDRFPELGIGRVGGATPRTVAFVRGSARSRTPGWLAARDGGSDVHPAGRGHGAEIVAARVVHRPGYRDLYARIDVDSLPGPREGAPGVPAAGDPLTLYVMKFQVDDRPYELRAQTFAALGPIFGLFDCDGAAPCRKASTLAGGYGTAGESVVIHVPLSKLGSRSTRPAISDAVAFTAFGSFYLGARDRLDDVRLR